MNVNQNNLLSTLCSKRFRNVIIQRQKEQQENAFLVFYKDSSNTHQVNNKSLENCPHAKQLHRGHCSSPLYSTCMMRTKWHVTSVNLRCNWSVFLPKINKHRKDAAIQRVLSKDWLFSSPGGHQWCVSNSTMVHSPCGDAASSGEKLVTVMLVVESSSGEISSAQRLNVSFSWYK